MRVRRVFKGGVTAMVVALLGTGWGAGIGQAQESDVDVKGVQVLTRGPVHEAFAGIVTFNPVAGVLVEKAPPADIEEIPPAERPEGTNITWIPGYWAWDDERSDYLWVSGTWRALPPGRQWMAGYWADTTGGYQWTSGYWGDATVEETTYLPAPPATLEDGPNIKAPSRDYSWTPGNWMWRQERYAWSPGYWAPGRADWNWIPAHYVWTPRGYIYVDGYWDYSMQRRGMLFAPVYFESGAYSRPGYSYSPSIVLGLAMFVEHLFLRPNYNHYYFGDYYNTGYNRRGYFSATAYQSSRYGYDPIYSHQRWEHREDQGWDQRALANFRYRTENENARPPQTWNAMRTIDASTAESKQNALMVAAPIEQLAKRKDGPVRFQSVAKEDQKMLVQRNQEMRKTSNERRTLEARGDSRESTPKPGETAPITKVKLPKSPIVAKPVNELKKGQAPPALQRSLQKDTSDKQAESDSSGRKPKMDRPGVDKADKNNPKTEPRKPGPQVTPRDKQILPDRPTKEEKKEAQPKSEQRVKETPDKVREQPTGVREKPVRSPEKVEKKEKPTPEKIAKESPARVSEQPSRKGVGKAPQRDERPKTKEGSTSEDPNESEKPVKKDRKKDSARD